MSTCGRSLIGLALCVALGGTWALELRIASVHVINYCFLHASVFIILRLVFLFYEMVIYFVRISLPVPVPISGRQQRIRQLDCVGIEHGYFR